MMRRAMVALATAVCLAAPLPAQTPTPDQARALLQSRPELGGRIRGMIGNSGLSPSQVRARLLAAGYPGDLLDAYLGDDGVAPQPDDRVLEAVRKLGFVSDEGITRPRADSVYGTPGLPRADLQTATIRSPIFGLDVFRRVTNQFEPAAAGPVDASYRLGPGDQLVLVLSGDIEAAYSLDVTREGFIVIPQVGQLFVAGLTMEALNNLLYTRLGRVYSGMRRGPGATAVFQVSVARLRTNQVFVIGDVAQPGSYQVSSAGTALTALYLAGGPTETGSFRRIEIRRGGAVVDTFDLYDYLLRGDNRHDRRLETGDVVFVPVRGVPVSVDGAVNRPAIYELKPDETLRELVAAAGGFEPGALRRRIQIDRILPPAARTEGGRDRVVLEITDDELAGESAPAVAMEPGDAVTVFSITERRRNAVAVEGNVWTPGRIGYTTGMRLSQAIRLAGGPKPDSYLGQILVSRLRPDSTRIQLRSAFLDSTGAVTDDLALFEDDQVTVFSRTDFRPDRYLIVTGAVNSPGRIPYTDGMTLRDALLRADGLREDALLTEAEIARMPEERVGGALATTLRVSLDSTYLFDRGPDGRYLGPPGIDARAAGAPEVPLAPYDNVLILPQPEWELPQRVSVAGQVRYPGTYTLRRKNERLTDLIERAGGLTSEAYARGAELHRRSEGRDPARLAVVTRLEGQRVDSTERVDDRVRLGIELANRVGLNLPRALERPGAPENLRLHAGDSLYVPAYNATVRVLGEVNAPTTVIYREGWRIDRYIEAAGGSSTRADKGRAYVVQPGGQLESVKRRFLLPDGNPRPMPGSVVVVPERDPSERKDWAGLLGSIAQILASTVAIVVVATR